MENKSEAVRKWDFVVAPLCESALIAIAGLAGLGLHQPLLFASLGPTAYELIETPKRKSAQPYNVIVGHLVGVLAAMAALWLTNAWGAPRVDFGNVPVVRIWAAVIAAGLTVLATLLIKATQPAATSTTLLVALGILRGWHGAAIVIGAVLLIAAIGEPLRRWRALKQEQST